MPRYFQLNLELVEVVDTLLLQWISYYYYYMIYDTGYL